MAKLGTERTAVQNPLIQYACEIGWEYINPEETLQLRGGMTGLILKETFADQILKLNPEFINNPMNQNLIKIISSKMSVAVGGFYFHSILGNF